MSNTKAIEVVINLPEGNRPMYSLSFAGKKKTGTKLAEDELKQDARRIQ